MFACLGGVAVVMAVLLLYPYSIEDLINGLRANAQLIVGRSGGGLFTYYIRSDFLPLWGISIFVMVIAVCVKKPTYLLVLPFIWYFGLRVPPTNYNLMPVMVGTMLFGHHFMSNVWRSVAIISLLVPAVLGLGQLSLRDVLSVAAYPDSYAKSKDLMDDMIVNGPPIVTAPEFSVFTNPQLVAVAGADASQAIKASDGHRRAAIVADNGSQGRCPDGTNEVGPKPKSQQLLMFKSSGSWAVHVCYTQ
jgi:hypothetical protein